MKGLFITFEGTEGSGKTSVIRKVGEYFDKLGYPVFVTREPGGSRISELIRNIILNKEHTEMDPRTEALLFAASRRQHLVERILPALEAHKIVLCDRFVDSSLIYQGVARNLGIDEVMSINQFAIENHFPDRTIYIDVRPEVGLSRVFGTPNREVNRLDLEQVAFHKKIYEGYHELMKKYPDRIRSINGEADIDTVTKAAIDQIAELL
ncbi:MAG TPA: dTMP kinase [Bacillota bacterium]|nr:dTMP kinase [Bacillota bacterium]HPF42027.1 dTMP kinase [Bacillota bacterium]HPJ85899.1 dTMP kinase [Bacillota bacterium]HPQ61793.1 dTMP kinase [Bacillota bacterium]HRX91230.1 dTMP kinase [Candidatus Izemoplasmatales bacterium]